MDVGSVAERLNNWKVGKLTHTQTEGDFFARDRVNQNTKYVYQMIL